MYKHILIPAQGTVAPMPEVSAAEARRLKVLCDGTQRARRAQPAEDKSWSEFDPETLAQLAKRTTRPASRR
jgi:hypothetical protein